MLSRRNFTALLGNLPLAALGGRKGLYSTSYYGEDEFWRQYNGQEYTELKRAYDPDGRLLGLYDKCVRGR